MYKRIFPLIICFLFITATYADPVSQEQAERVAINWMIERSEFIPEQIIVQETYTITDDGFLVYYVINFLPSGFVIVSGDDIAYPIIGYSYAGNYDPLNIPPAFTGWMDSVIEEITVAALTNRDPVTKTVREWERLNVDINRFILYKTRQINRVGPLLTSQWNQGNPYNILTPVNTPVGCVAVAMAQIMRHFRYPNVGRGENRYTHQVTDGNNVLWSGILEADYSVASYNWNNMPSTISGQNNQGQIEALSDLLFQTGVAVNMNYQIGGSGAFSINARDAFVNHFNYSIETAYILREQDIVSDVQWIDLLKNEIEQGRPIYYRGSNPDGRGGHAFVVHGYEEGERFYVNWGWGGSLDGLFTLEVLTPGRRNYSHRQGAILNIVPTPNSELNDNTPVLFSYQRRWNAPPEGGDTDPIFVINSNSRSTERISYNIDSDVHWLTTDVTDGITPESFIIIAEPNNTGSSRSGSIIISATSNVFTGSAIKTITIEQEQTGEVDNYTDIALVIDRSGSMASYGYMEPAKNAAKTFIDFMQVNDNLAVVSFASSGSVDFPLQTITFEETKNNAKYAIEQIVSTGLTSIGDGLRLARDELSKGRIDQQQAIILLSDGFENAAPYVTDILPTLPKNINVYTIALGPMTDTALLNDIASSTGGSYHGTDDPSELQAIYNTIRGIITDFQMIASHSGTIEQGSTYDFTTPIDGLTTRTQFSLVYSSGLVDLALVTPDGTRIDSSYAVNDDDIQYSRGDTYVLIDVRSPQSGIWRQEVIGRTLQEPASFSTSVQGLSDLRQRAFLDRTEIDAGQPMVIKTIITANNQPVTGAEVVALIRRPNSAFASIRKLHATIENSTQSNYMDIQSIHSTVIDTLILYDDGLHSDSAPNDGLYANVYTNTSVDGNYTITIKANGNVPGIGDFSRQEQFSTVVRHSNRPHVPILTAVANGAVNVPLDPELRWEQASNAEQYQLEVYYLLSSAESTTLITVVDTVTADNTLQIEQLENNRTYHWRVRSISSAGAMSDWSQEWSFSTFIMADDEEMYAYPNPFNPLLENIKIRFTLGEASDVKVLIYDISNTLVWEHFDAHTEGLNEILWDGKNNNDRLVANGTYFYILQTGNDKRKIGKISVIK